MTTSHTVRARVSRSALFGYGLAAAPVQFAYVLIIIMYLKYAVDELGTSAAAIGVVFLVARLWDAVSDPMVGSWSDRTAHRLGRRRPWLYVAAPLLVVFSVMMWAPPASLSGGALIAWITVAILGFYTAYTIFEVPHLALGAELTFDRQERNRVFGIRQVMRALASVAAGTGGVYMVQQGVEVATVMAYSIGALTLLFVFGGVALVPSERAEFSGRGGQHPYNAVRDVFANRHARLLLFVFFIESVGVGGISVLTPFVLAYVIGLESMVPVVIGTFMLSSLAAVPLWVRLSGYFEKRHLWLFAMVQSAVGYSLIFWVGEGDWQLMAFSSFLTGTASACSNTLGLALKAEVIDFDEYLTGERKEGVYFAGWSFVQKLAGGVMVAVVGFSLEWTGYVENAADQTQGVKDAIIFLTAGIPLIGYSIGSLAFTRFDLSEAEHARIRAEIDARA